MPDRPNDREWTCIERWSIEKSPGEIVMAATLGSADRRGTITVKGPLADPLDVGKRYRLDFTLVKDD